MRYSILILLLTVTAITGCRNEKVHLKIVETTDIHGRFFNYDFASDTFKEGSLAQIAAYMEKLRQKNQHVILLDNGDIIQGDPVAYYANYIDTGKTHLLPKIYNMLGYDAASIGNHDIEAGPKVYNKIKKALEISWLGANIINKKSGKPAFKPYTIITKGGVKIAVLGLTTPGIPNWLPKKLYKGLAFGDMVESATRWMPEIKAKQPDIIIGLFHAGLDAEYGGYDKNAYKNPNATLAVAKKVPGFDIIFAGHDHQTTAKTVTNAQGDTVWIVNAGSHGKNIGQVDLTFNKSEKSICKVNGKIINITERQPAGNFTNQLKPYLDSVKNYFYQPVGKLITKLCPQKSLFGPSEFMRFIHEVQLSATNATASLSAPLQIHHCIEPDTIYRSDVFSLYQYENYLATLNMSISEIDGFLEHAVKNWFNTMQSSSDSLLLYDEKGKLANPYYNFSSAAGIRYEVDVTNAPGNRVHIIAAAGKTNIRKTDTIRVAINSYRLAGGGGHMPEGAKITREKLKNRKVQLSEKPIKTIMMDYFGAHKTIAIKNIKNWKLLPKEWVQPAKKREEPRFK